ncbi:MAG: hypothetical protein A2Y58_06065 [Chloroflexi bacterium RBG_13_51_52]|nr:MAG: hypothetical protein A2Y58_06065 [Chloroflexi bacterium RBG_13_51_52]
MKLWQKAFGPVARLEGEINIQEIAEKYELAGGAIVNVVRYCSLMAVNEGTQMINNRHLVAGVRREYSKEGRFL